MDQPTPSTDTANASLKERLLSGEALHFLESDPDQTRTLEGDWIAQAISGAIKVDLHNAIIIGRLDLSFAKFSDQFTLMGCRVKCQSTFAHATFTRDLVLSKTKFEKGLDLGGASLQHAGRCENVECLDGEVRLDDISVRGHWRAAKWRTNDGVSTTVQRASFHGLCDFSEAIFGGGVSFRAAHFADQILFQGATFKSKVSFDSAFIGQHAVFQSVPASNIGGATFEQDAIFIRTRIGGQVFFQGAVFKKDVTFDSARIDGGLLCINPFVADQPPTVFEGNANFSNAAIKGVAFFSGVRFAQTANFVQCRIDGNASFQGDSTVHRPGAVFEGDAVFASAHFRGSLDLRGVQFKKDASFNQVTVDGNLNCNGEGQERATLFEGSALFVQARIVGQADFRETAFSQDTNFALATFGSLVIFRPESERATQGALFAGKAAFSQTHFAAAVEFNGAVFKQPADFSLARFDGPASFTKSSGADSSATAFEGGANFSAARFKNLYMNGASFGADASFDGAVVEEYSNWERSRFAGTCSFNSAHFLRAASFKYVKFVGDVTFSTARFEGDALFTNAAFGPEQAPENKHEASFGGAHFAGVADLLGATFYGNADFYAVSASGLARFEYCTFCRKASFNEATVTSLHFSTEEEASARPQFQSDVNLVGCSYQHLTGDLRKLVARLEPYDRQPYAQLEKVLRAAGRAWDADKIYLEGRHRERRLKWKRGDFAGWFISLVYWAGANYGVRPIQLVIFAAALLTLGTLYFSSAGTVREDKPVNRSGTAPRGRLSNFEAFGVSLHQFLPVQVPLGSRWVPIEQPAVVALPGISKSLPPPLSIPSFFATFFLRLAGWILVPLGVAALTGLLRTKTTINSE